MLIILKLAVRIGSLSLMSFYHDAALENMIKHYNYMTVSACIKITAIMTSQVKVAANYGPVTATGSQISCQLNALSVVNCCKLPRCILRKLGSVFNAFISLIIELYNQ